MNNSQRMALVGVMGGLVATFLFPPHAVITDGGGALRLGYAFITDIPQPDSVYITMLLVEWLGIGIIGGIVYFLFEEN